jgi:SAM-dependent methyltransferase
MTKSNKPPAEGFQPIPLRVGTSRLSKMLFFLRCLVDIQIYTIWSFLSPKFPTLTGKILDVGCGDMPYRTFLKNAQEYTGIDIPQATAFRMLGGDAIIAFDGVSIPFTDALFDTVLCTEVIEHAVEPEMLISEIFRVLKPGGVLLATVPFSARVHYAPFDFNRFTKYRLKNILAPFSDVEIFERGNDISVIANKLIVLFIRMLRPSLWSFIRWPFEIFILPISVIFLIASHISILCNFGSKDDPLGYSIIAKK